jgi:hypothetical protein
MSQIENNLKHCIETCDTGDLVLFSTNKWYSDFIKLGSFSKYTHCGIIVKSPTWINEKLTGIYLLESGREPFIDVTDNSIHFGVELVEFTQVVEEYKIKNLGEIYYRKLNCERNKNFYENFKLVYEECKGKPYNKNPLDWLEALFGYYLYDKKITSRFWCSALVSYIYVKTFIISDIINWSLIPPKYYSSSNIIDFINGSSMEKEIKII